MLKGDKQHGLRQFRHNESWQHRRIDRLARLTDSCGAGDAGSQECASDKLVDAASCRADDG
jgi:hypothetical protein